MFLTKDKIEALFLNSDEPEFENIQAAMTDESAYNIAFYYLEIVINNDITKNNLREWVNKIRKKE